MGQQRNVFMFVQVIIMSSLTTKSYQIEAYNHSKPYFLGLEYLHAGDYNILAVDWSKLASWDNYAGRHLFLLH